MLNPITLLARFRPKARAAAARRFLEETEQNFNGKPPIPEELAVELRNYGCVWKGKSAVRVVLLGDRTDPLGYRLRLEPFGPAPEDVLVDPQRVRQLVDMLSAMRADLGELMKLIERPSTAPLTERDTEVLRIFGVELVPGGLIAARLRSEGKE